MIVLSQQSMTPHCEADPNRFTEREEQLHMTKQELEDRLVQFAARCVNVCGALPTRKIGSSGFADQLFRSATSVAANYAEAAEAESRKDFVHKLKIATKELSESRVWLKIIGESGYLPNEKLRRLIAETEELPRILGASITTARSRQQESGGK